jgi:hypothetical protein
MHQSSHPHPHAAFDTAYTAVAAPHRAAKECRAWASEFVQLESAMKSFAVLVCVLALLCSANAIPTIISTGVDCLNGISCAPGQTCMSNTTGVGMAVRLRNHILFLLIAYLQPIVIPTVFLLPSPQCRSLHGCSFLLPRFHHLR